MITPLVIIERQPTTMKLGIINRLGTMRTLRKGITSMRSTTPKKPVSITPTSTSRCKIHRREPGNCSAPRARRFTRLSQSER
jgi:hypothetical protein